jgi:hypothetical protein
MWSLSALYADEIVWAINEAKVGVPVSAVAA